MGSGAARRGEETPLSLRDVAPFAKPPMKGEVGSEAVRRGEETPLSLRDVAPFAKPLLKGEVGSEAARRGESLCHCVTLPLLQSLPGKGRWAEKLLGGVNPSVTACDVAPFAKPPMKGEVGSGVARRGTPLSLRDISPFRGDKLEHCVTLPLLQSLPGKGRWAVKLFGGVNPSVTA